MSRHVCPGDGLDTHSRGRFQGPVSGAPACPRRSALGQRHTWVRFRSFSSRNPGQRVMGDFAGIDVPKILLGWPNCSCLVGRCASSRTYDPPVGVLQVMKGKDPSQATQSASRLRWLAGLVGASWVLRYLLQGGLGVVDVCWASFLSMGPADIFH